jgi:hypothetical protein
VGQGETTAGTSSDLDREPTGDASKRTVVLASSADHVALELPHRLSRPDVVVLTPRDLSRPGWSYRPGCDASALAVGDDMFESGQIAAVVTRLPWVSPLELPHIVEGDRAYVAAEMGAFLVAWLAELRCPVANRPSPSCLCGPFWRHERWIAEAARAGLAVEPARRIWGAQRMEYPEPCRDGGVSVPVVGERCLGEHDAWLAEQALRLARAAGVETLTVDFTQSGAGARVRSASPWPRLEDAAVAQALLDHLGASAPHPQAHV